MDKPSGKRKMPVCFSNTPAFHTKGDQRFLFFAFAFVFTFLPEPFAEAETGAEPSEPAGTAGVLAGAAIAAVCARSLDLRFSHIT